MGFPAPAPSPMEGEAQVEEKPQGAESGGEGRGGDHKPWCQGGVWTEYLRRDRGAEDRAHRLWGKALRPGRRRGGWRDPQGTGCPRCRAMRTPGRQKPCASSKAEGARERCELSRGSCF